MSPRALAYLHELSAAHCEGFIALTFARAQTRQPAALKAEDQAFDQLRLTTIR